MLNGRGWCVKQRDWKLYGLWILFVEAVGALSGWLTRGGSAV